MPKSAATDAAEAWGEALALDAAEWRSRQPGKRKTRSQNRQIKTGPARASLSISEHFANERNTRTCLQ
jgi:hypothetical protein